MHLSRIGVILGVVALAAVSSLRAATGTIQDVQHVVILMQENRSYDHYFGTMAGGRGFGDRNALLLGNGQTVFNQPTGATNVMPFPATNQCIDDVDHSFASGVADWDLGKWNQWVPAKGVETMTYYTPDFVPLHQSLADNFTVCDNYFCSLLGPTFPNRIYLFTGMIDPSGANGGPAVENQVPVGGFTWTTYPERLQNAGVSWKVYRPFGDWFGDALPMFAQYANALPGSPLYDRGVAAVPDVVDAFQTDVANGTLPQVSWIIPTFAESEHPSYSPIDGEVFIKALLDALASNPAVLNSTVFILTYDEAGGFFDHVPAPTAPPGTADEFVRGDPLGLGVRLPTMIISPWSRGGRVCSQVFDHTSIIRFIETWTGVREPNISAWRRQACGDLTSAFDFTSPNTNAFPALPDVTWYENTAYYPVPPALPVMPVQQTNARVAMPLPYQPEVTAQTDCALGQIHLTMTNAGSASVHFAVFANPVQASGPVQFDVAPGQSLPFTAAANLGQGYDFTCYGPNGFQRRFAGSIPADCGQIEIIPSIDTNAGAITLVQQNNSGSALAFIVSDGYGLAAPWTNRLPPGVAATNSIPAVANNNGWYDLTVVTTGDTNFIRHYTGHIETGAMTATEPVLSAIASAPVLATAPAPPGNIGLTNSSSFLYLMATLPAVPDGSALSCYAASSGTNMVLVYPGWASNCTVLGSATLAPAVWSPVAVTVTNLGNYAVATTSLTNGAAFFCLRLN